MNLSRAQNLERMSLRKHWIYQGVLIDKNGKESKFNRLSDSISHFIFLSDDEDLVNHFVKAYDD